MPIVPTLPMEKAALVSTLASDITIAPGGEHRVLPNLDVRNYDRLHIHIGRNAMSVAGLSVRVLFATPITGLHCGAILADSTVWFEETVSQREFSWTAPPTAGDTGFVVSVPVVAPLLFDVILRNTGTAPLNQIYVTLLAQEI